ncbi:uncharacterized protein [Notamacropus eugenii]|uniref:uncharacterized protein n=1 Tax=Notamacropus eugenii TaxID=9315 RepID=UPI003B6859D9
MTTAVQVTDGGGAPAPAFIPHPFITGLLTASGFYTNPLIEGVCSAKLGLGGPHSRAVGACRPEVPHSSSAVPLGCLRRPYHQTNDDVTCTWLCCERGRSPVQGASLPPPEPAGSSDQTDPHQGDRRGPGRAGGPRPLGHGLGRHALGGSTGRTDGKACLPPAGQIQRTKKRRPGGKTGSGEAPALGECGKQGQHAECLQNGERVKGERQPGEAGRPRWAEKGSPGQGHSVRCGLGGGRGRAWVGLRTKRADAPKSGTRGQQENGLRTAEAGPPHHVPSGPGPAPEGPGHAARDEGVTETPSPRTGFVATWVLTCGKTSHLGKAEVTAARGALGLH